jgi:hypothetical protein
MKRDSSVNYKKEKVTQSFASDLPVFLNETVKSSIKMSRRDKILVETRHAYLKLSPVGTKYHLNGEPTLQSCSQLQFMKRDSSVNYKKEKVTQSFASDLPVFLDETVKSSIKMSRRDKILVETRHAYLKLSPVGTKYHLNGEPTLQSCSQLQLMKRNSSVNYKKEKVTQSFASDLPVFLDETVKSSIKMSRRDKILVETRHAYLKLSPVGTKYHLNGEPTLQSCSQLQLMKRDSSVNYKKEKVTQSFAENIRVSQRQNSVFL